MKKMYYLFSIISSFALFATDDIAEEQKPIESNYEAITATSEESPAPTSEIPAEQN